MHSNITYDGELDADFIKEYSKRGETGRMRQDSYAIEKQALHE